MPWEIVVVDNGSTDETRSVVGSFVGLPLRYVYEAVPGIAAALNAGVGFSTADYFLRVDDDVVVPDNWLHSMSSALAAGQADVIAGGVRIAPHLNLSWLETWHRVVVGCSTETMSDSEPFTAPGPNMAFTRRAFEATGGFDAHLGGGGLGCGEDNLFTLQVRAAGLKVKGLTAVQVEHHFPAERLSRKGIVQRAQASGRSDAFIAYHWFHRDVRYARLKAWTFRLLTIRPSRRPVGKELSRLVRRGYHMQMAEMSGQSRIYTGQKPPPVAGDLHRNEDS